MRRGPKPAKPKEAKPPVARRSPKDDATRVRDLEKRLAEALEQQAATAEILRVISSSPTDIQPVLDTMAERAARLCDAYDAVILRLEGGVLRRAAHYGPIPPLGVVIAATRSRVSGRAVVERQPVQVADAQAESEEFPEIRTLAQEKGFRTILSVPLLREDVAIGTIDLRRTEVQPFTDGQIVLLKTFADQAVIAIENARLFNETKEALEQQTATSEILRVIATSPTDLQPVLDALVVSAGRLCQAADTFLLLVERDQLITVAGHGSGYKGNPGLSYPINRGWLSGRAVMDMQVLQVEDLASAEAEFPLGAEIAVRFGHRTALALPLVRKGVAIGALFLRRQEVRQFSGKEIALLQIFADQAVIAIENVRLFKELQEKNRDLTESLEQQTATSEILRVISSSPTDVQPVFDAIAEQAMRLCEAVVSNVCRFDGELVHLAATTNVDPDGVMAIRGAFPMRLGPKSAATRAVLKRTLVHIPDILDDPEYGITQQSLASGFRSVLAVPMLREGSPLGSIIVGRPQPGPFSARQIALLETFADQAVIAIENVRLFKELEAANRELAAASQHKSEFLANMSHELRTPLNAIIGFSEVLSERMFGELNEKQEEYSKDIHASGQHLLSLINDILDLSKIEAGRMELELSEFHLPTALDSALTLVRERAGRRNITLQMSVDERLGQVQADERKVRQVVLNLLSNAIKFTPEGGSIEVRAVPKDGSVEVSVSDTGVGIALEDQEAVFEEFRQVGTADKKVEGTGLGLTLCRKFVELHGGRIWVKSEVGTGSTFTFALPVTRESGDSVTSRD